MKTIFGAILFFFLCLFFYTKFFGTFPLTINSVQTTKTDLFQVTGEGSSTAVPDTATISFGVTKQAATVKDAQDQTNSTVKDIQDALQKQGVDSKNIKTTNYSLNPNYTPSGQINGYSVTQNIDLKIQPLDGVNKAIDTVTTNGANLLGQVSFGFTDEKKQQLEDEARKDAVTKAKAKADSLARASGIHLGNIINVVENTDQPGLIMPLALQAKREDSASIPTQVTPGTATIHSTITLSYQLY